MTAVTTIRYATLNFSYDKEKLTSEVMAYEHLLEQVYAASGPLRRRPFNTVSEERYKQLEDTWEPNATVVPITGWLGYNFTRVVDNPDIKSGIIPIREKHEHWEWQPELNLPYLKSLVEGLGFTQFRTIKLYTLEPMHFVPVHADSSTAYYENNISATFGIDNGGTMLTTHDKRRLYKIESDCFIFRDDCWHGTGEATSKRILVRISGKADESKISQYIDSKTIIR
jgi:hypothetical protein